MAMNSWPYFQELHVSSAHQMESPFRGRSEEFAVIGGAFLLWLPGPVMALWLVGIVIPLAPLFALPWLTVVFPHQWLVRSTGYGFDLVFTTAEAWTVAVVQWVIVGALYTVASRRLSPRARVALAPLVIVATGIVFHLVTGWLGLIVQADWV